MDIREILETVPHRYPMLLVDRVLECEPGKRLLALKNVSMNEPFFADYITSDLATAVTQAGFQVSSVERCFLSKVVTAVAI